MEWHFCVLLLRIIRIKRTHLLRRRYIPLLSSGHILKCQWTEHVGSALWSYQFQRLIPSTCPPIVYPACLPFKQFLPLDDSYAEGLYSVEIGGNDIINAILFENKSAVQVLTQVIPAAMINILDSIKVNTLWEKEKKLRSLCPPSSCCSQDMKNWEPDELRSFQILSYWRRNNEPVQWWQMTE